MSKKKFPIRYRMLTELRVHGLPRIQQMVISRLNNRLFNLYVVDGLPAVNTVILMQELTDV